MPYRWILARDPNCTSALHGLGILALQVGRADVAAELLRQAAALDRGDPAIHSNLGEVYRHLHRLDEAIASYRQALVLKPKFCNALSNLGLALMPKIGSTKPCYVCSGQSRSNQISPRPTPFSGTSRHPAAIGKHSFDSAPTEPKNYRDLSRN